MMTSFYFIMLIVACALVTWLPRIIPFIIAKKFTLPVVFMRWLHYIPICILSALVADSLIDQHSFLRINWENCLIFIPTVIVACWTKSLSYTVICGVITTALLRFLL